MSYQLHEKLVSLTPYEPVKGDFSIRLDANECGYDLPPFLKEKLAERLDSLPLNRYPDPCAREVTAAFAKMYDLDPDCVTAGNGSDELIQLIVSAMLGRGEKVLTVEPDFSMYAFYSHVCENPIIRMKKGQDLRLDPDKLIAEAKEQGARAVFFSNPCNPTSLGLCREDVRRIIKGVDGLVVLDEAYMDFWDQSMLGEISDYDNLIILRTCSKALGMAALRLGFAVSSPGITRALRAAKSPYNVNSLTQAFAATVLEYPEHLKKQAVALVSLRKALRAALYDLFEGVEETIVYPSCTNFVLISTPLAREIFLFLAENGVAVRILSDSLLRITSGTEEENKTLLELLYAWKNKRMGNEPDSGEEWA